MNTSGTISLAYVHYKMDVNLAFRRVLFVSTGDQPCDAIIITDLHGEARA